MDSTLLRIREATALTGDRRSTFYVKVADGLLPRGVSLGGNMTAWPRRELEAVNELRIRGRPEEEIRALVVQLESERTGQPATPRRKRPQALGIESARA